MAKDASATLKDLQQRRESLAVRAEIAELERHVRAAETANNLVESEWGSLVSRQEYLTDTPGWGVDSSLNGRRATRPEDRQDGKFAPIFETEYDLAVIRGIGRNLAATEVGRGVLESLTSFTIGAGFEYTAKPMAIGSDENLAAAVQSALEQCFERNGWWEGSSAGDSLETELFQRSIVDGESFAWVCGRDVLPDIVVVEPDHITEPADKHGLENYIDEYGLDWSFGCATEPNRIATRRGYFAKWNGSGSDWDYLRNGSVTHIRSNVPRGVKRGVSDYYEAFLTLERASKLLGNTMQGAAIQACIAYIRKAATGTTLVTMQGTRNTAADYQSMFNRPRGGSRQIYQEKFHPGKVIDASGFDFQYGPMGSPSGPVFVDVIAAALRIAGARWQMPEYMISGDASNANYSSTLVAGGPFAVSRQRQQRRFKGYFAEIAWKVLRHMAARGAFADYGVYSVAELKQRVTLDIQAPCVTISDRLQDEQLREIRKRNGVLSARTWAAQVDLDYDDELGNGAVDSSMPAAFPIASPVAESYQQRAKKAASILWEGYP